MSSSDKIKEQVDFLRVDNISKQEYMLIKTGKQVLNLPKHQISKTTHAPIHNYFINPKNNYSEKPFNGSSSFYIDFDIPKIEATFY